MKADEVKQRDILERLRDNPIVPDDYDPVVAMALIACDPSTPIMMRLKAHTSVAEYVHPKLRAVEVKGNVEVTGGVLRIPTSPGNAEWDRAAVMNAEATAAMLQQSIEGELVCDD